MSVDLAPALEGAALDEAVMQSWAPILRMVGRPRLAGEAPNEPVMRCVQALARDPLCLARGEFLTTIERFGVAWANALLEYVCQIKPYNDRQCAFDCWATLYNDGEKPITLVERVLTRHVPKQIGSITGDGWSQVDGAEYNDVRKIVLDPGKTVDLVAERAIGALRRYSWEAQTPAFKASTSEPAGNFRLREVAYRCEWRDYETQERYSVDSRAKAKRSE